MLLLELTRMILCALGVAAGMLILAPVYTQLTNLPFCDNAVVLKSFIEGHL